MYLYQLNYPPQEKDLCHLEMTCLFHDEVEITNNCIISSKSYPANQSVFFKSKLEILCHANSLPHLFESVQALAMTFQNFKLSYLKNMDYPFDYETKMANLQTLSHLIKGVGNIQNPEIILGIAYLDGIWYFGVLTQDHQAWLKYHHKPQSYSQSLSTRLARSLVNVACGGNLQLSLVDPCCGAGTVLLEALDLGYKIQGYDIHKGMCWKANRNLSYFGFEPSVICQDLNTLEASYDVAILDIPYNLYSDITPPQQAQLIRSCFRIADTLVLVSYEDLTVMTEAQGWHIQNVCTVTKMKFIRYIYRCVKK